MVTVVDGGIGACARGTHGHTVGLVEVAIPKGEDIGFHDKGNRIQEFPSREALGEV